MTKERDKEKQKNREQFQEEFVSYIGLKLFGWVDDDMFFIWYVCRNTTIYVNIYVYILLSDITRDMWLLYYSRGLEVPK